MVRKFWVFLLTFGLLSFLKAQDMSAESRARFIKDQDQYLETLKLNLDQWRAYQNITVKYEKQNMAARQRTRNPGALKSRLKSIRKAKDANMKRILNKYQFKLYLKRQKEIDTKYE